MGRILIAVLIIWIIVKITKAIFQKSCVGCRKRISKKANVCSYCRTQQPEILDKKRGKKFLAGMGKLFSLVGLFIMRKRTKLDTAFVLIAIAGALFISVSSYSWYIDTMKSSYEKNAVIGSDSSYNIPNAGTSVIYAEQERDKHNVLYALLDSYDIAKTINALLEEQIMTGGMESWDRYNKYIYDNHLKSGRGYIDRLIRPLIFWEDTSWRYVYGNDSPMPSKAEIEEVIASDPHLKNLPGNHIMIRLLRGELGNFFDAYMKGAFKAFPTQGYDVQKYYYDYWVHGQTEWNPYAKDEFWAINYDDIGMVAEYAVLKHRYGKLAAQHEVMIRRPYIIYDKLTSYEARRARERIIQFGLKSAKIAFDGGSKHITAAMLRSEKWLKSRPDKESLIHLLLEDLQMSFNGVEIIRPTTLRFQEGIEHVPYTYDLMQDKKLVHDLFSGNAYTFAWMYAFPISLLFGLMAFSFVRFLGFVFLGQKEVTENVKVRKHTIPCRHCRVEIADFDECCYSCGKTQKV